MIATGSFAHRSFAHRSDVLCLFITFDFSDEIIQQTFSQSMLICQCPSDKRGSNPVHGRLRILSHGVPKEAGVIMVVAKRTPECYTGSVTPLTPYLALIKIISCGPENASQPIGAPTSGPCRSLAEIGSFLLRFALLIESIHAKSLTASTEQTPTADLQPTPRTDATGFSQVACD